MTIKVPCKECLVLAACKYKEEIKCKLLFDWLMNVPDNERRKDQEHFKTLKECFGQSLYRVDYYLKDEVTLIRDIDTVSIFRSPEGDDE